MTLEPLSDVSKLCKLFSILVDRATKGTSLVERSEFEKGWFGLNNLNFYIVL